MTYQQKRSLYYSIMEELAPLVKRAIFESESNDDDFHWDFISIDGISQEALDRQYVDYEEFAWVNKLRINLSEGKNKDMIHYIPRDIIDDLVSEFHLEKWQYGTMVINRYETFDYREGYDIDDNNRDSTIQLIVPNVNKNVSIMKDFLEKRGYTLLRKIKYEKPGQVWFIMAFGPMVQENIKSRLMKIVNKSRFIYHTTPAYNKEAILKNGFIPKNRPIDSQFTYEPRVYFFSNETKNYRDVVKKYGQFLNNEDEKCGRKSCDKYVIFEVNLLKIPRDVEFFDDPLLQDAIYTKQAIPASAISNSYEYSVL